LIRITELVAATPVTTLVIGFILLVLTTFFLVIFLARAVVLIAKLSKIALTLASLKSPRKQALEQVFAADKTLAHLWREYADTLHRQQEFGGSGREALDILRSTVPASSIFTTDTIVDAQLWTEFFKHVPGIFTGLGIIGTFSGLIRGLQAFQVSADPNVVRGGLEGLMHQVGDAFVVSAIAIGLAMFSTLVERICVATLLKKIEEINARLDGFFVSGAGEEYLARLTRASEDSAAQAKILKDALVGDLERILTTLAERQVEAQRVGIRELGENITLGITGTLAGPLDALAASAHRTGEGNNDAVTRLLTDVLAGFSQRLEDLFGGQISGINKLQQQTMDALGAAVAKLNQMVTAIEQAGTKSADSLNQRLLSALGDMEAHQRTANERMAVFVDQLRGTIDQTQSETNRKLQETLSQLGTAVDAQIAALREQGERSVTAQLERESAASGRTDANLRLLATKVEEVMGSLRTHLDAAAEAQGQREQRLSDSTASAVTNLSLVAEMMMSEARAVSAGVSAAVDAMRVATTTAIDKMNSGSETLYLAASEFKTAGQSVSNVFQEAEALSHGLRQSAGWIANASADLQGVVVDHAGTRDALAKMIEEMRGIVENAKREAGIGADAISRIEAASQGLGQAQKQAEDYLNEVTRILSATHEKYSTSLSSALQEQYKAFYSRLSEATGLLRAAIEELAVTVQPNVKRAAE
jgi:hypothetical protein